MELGKTPGGISLVKFIRQVKRELLAAEDNTKPYMELQEIKLETHFELVIKSEAEVDFYVIDAKLAGDAKQLHKVELKFKPLPKAPPPGPPGPSGKKHQESEQPISQTEKETFVRVLTAFVAAMGLPKQEGPVGHGPTFRPEVDVSGDGDISDVIEKIEDMGIQAQAEEKYQAGAG
ncbi:MAG: hypothetical protein J0I77_17630 [Rudaea sp.]|uniref:trypco2 family protein n=1 Tax=unclassified Rudaea TaxID=2627037 RepID=UPI0010F54A17|nr:MULTISPECIES: trypco2 family protein [unclassified Rudaea]MBN8887549.1 hypothetical protein [Rudaea sp.]